MRSKNTYENTAGASCLGDHCVTSCRYLAAEVGWLVGEDHGVRLRSVGSIDVHAVLDWLRDNWLAFLALVVGVAAAIPAYAAVGQSRRQTKINQEFHDVAWEWRWTEPGVMKLTNRSDTCTVHRARARVTVDGRQHVAEAAAVGPGDSVVVPIAGAAKTFAEDLRGLEGTAERGKTWQGTLYQSKWVRMGWRNANRHKIEVSAAWRTKLGSPRVQVDRAVETSLGNLLKAD